MSNEWGEGSSATQKVVVLPNGDEVNVSAMTPAEVLRVANENGLRRFTVSSDDNGDNTIATSTDISGYNKLYIFPKEKVA